mgnify:CR=1 FL=1
MRRRRALALLLAAGMLCSGCSTGAISSNYRAVEDLELIQTIGVDRAPEGVCLSAATGKAGEDEAPKRMTQSGVSMLAALGQLQDRTPSAELFYAQTSYLLLGEEAAAAGRAAVRYRAATAAHPVTDSVKLANSRGFIEKSVDRKKVWLVQTPQVFLADLYRAALATAGDTATVTDDNALMEQIRYPVKLVECNRDNIKITTPDDICRAEEILRKRGEHV